MPQCQKCQLNHIPGLPWWPPTDPCPCPTSPPGSHTAAAQPGGLCHNRCQIPSTWCCLSMSLASQLTFHDGGIWLVEPKLLACHQVQGMLGKGASGFCLQTGYGDLKWRISENKAMCGHLSLGQHSPGCPAVNLFFWLCWVLVVANGIFHLCWGLWDLFIFSCVL